MKTQFMALFFFCVLIPFVPSHAQLIDRAKFQSADEASLAVCNTIFREKPYSYQAYFSLAFQMAISEAQFRSIVGEVIDATGLCANIERLSGPKLSGVFRMTSITGDLVTIELGVERIQGKIDGFRFQGFDLKTQPVLNWNDAIAAAAKYPGYVSITMERQGSIGRRLESTMMHPLGSAFKLYVLGALERAVRFGKYSWETSFPIREDWKSLPSGEMQKWPAGKEVSLKAFAENMIRISDNTATDHLIQILGREMVETEVLIMDNDFVEKNQPFLLTSDMFRLKWAMPVADTDHFISLSVADKREYLASKVAKVPLSQVGTNGVSMEKPSRIFDLEWFGSTHSICQAMYDLKSRPGNEVLKTLSLNTPFVDTGLESHWSYAGFKGGSEPGVLTLNYLLKSKAGEWGCVSVMWHDELTTVNQIRFMDFVQKLLKLAEDEI